MTQILKVSVNKKSVWIYDYYRKWAEIRKIPISALVLEAMTEYIHSAGARNVFVENIYIPEFLEFLKNYGITVKSSDGTFPRPKYRLEWADSLIVGYPTSDLITEFLFVSQDQAKKKQFEAMVETFQRAVELAIIETEKEQNG